MIRSSKIARQLKHLKECFLFKGLSILSEKTKSCEARKRSSFEQQNV